MHCPGCTARNDPEAEFCIECGRPFHQTTADAPFPTRPRKAYLFMIALLPVLALVAGIGYYKFFLPDGVAAFVNDEEIRLSELDETVAREEGEGSAIPEGLRHQILNQLITERIALQEARKAGISVSREEIAVAARDAQAASGLTDKSFNQEISSRFGNTRAFEAALERRLLIRKFIAERVAPPGADPVSARRAADQWMRDVTARAAVRIALAEQVAGPGCRCCNGEGGQDRKAGNITGQNIVAKQSPESNRMKTALDAALRYWHAKHGPDAIETQQTDFGCHIQVDIFQREKMIASLQYQSGIITEQ